MTKCRDGGDHTKCDCDQYEGVRHCLWCDMTY
jgi:hypothetical protein